MKVGWVGNIFIPAGDVTVYMYGLLVDLI